MDSQSVEPPLVALCVFRFRVLLMLSASFSDPFHTQATISCYMINFTAVRAILILSHRQPSVATCVLVFILCVFFMLHAWFFWIGSADRPPLAAICVGFSLTR